MSADILPGSAKKRPPASGGRFRSRYWLARELGLVGRRRPETLFYLDPPYHGSEDDYGDGLFGPEQFTLMAAGLCNLKVRFILSINDVPDIRETFAGFQMEEVELLYSVSGGKGRPARELIIC